MLKKTLTKINMQKILMIFSSPKIYEKLISEYFSSHTFIMCIFCIENSYTLYSTVAYENVNYIPSDDYAW